jgi:hypothetical protein
MNSSIRLILALEQVHNLMSLLEDNEYEKFLVSHLLPLEYELQRQLTNIQSSAKIKK